MASEKMVVQFQPYGSLPVLFMEKVQDQLFDMVGHVSFIIADCYTDQCVTSSPSSRQLMIVCSKYPKQRYYRETLSACRKMLTRLTKSLHQLLFQFLQTSFSISFIFAWQPSKFIHPAYDCLIIVSC